MRSFPQELSQFPPVNKRKNFLVLRQRERSKNSSERHRFLSRPAVKGPELPRRDRLGYCQSLIDQEEGEIGSSSTPAQRRQVTPSSTLAWKSGTEEPVVGCSPMVQLMVGHTEAASLSLFTHALEKGNGKPLPVRYPAWRIPGRRACSGCRLWGRTGRPQLKWLSSSNSSTLAILSHPKKSKRYRLIKRLRPNHWTLELSPSL